MSAKIILTSRFMLDPKIGKEISVSLPGNEWVSHYIDLDRTELLQIRAYEDISSFSAAKDELREDVERLKKHMVSDVVRELLEFVEAPKPCASRVPQTDFVQLRHIDVPPSKSSDYRRWRANTIFPEVMKSPAVEVFLAYHSIVSGQPGVMFLAGFSGDPIEYQSVYETERYREIVRQAGSEYISGGVGGLYTRTYARVAC
ncbi:hypothetical protein ACFW0H_16895 [Pseudomonas sp. CR3202]|uniref:hypothetical protein n=1 Tax=Pseudomonas sp. CR3202 TaxID=3351532 RepID=UPI003BF448F1